LAYMLLSSCYALNTKFLTVSGELKKQVFVLTEKSNQALIAA